MLSHPPDQLPEVVAQDEPQLVLHVVAVEPGRQVEQQRAVEVAGDERLLAHQAGAVSGARGDGPGGDHPTAYVVDGLELTLADDGPRRRTVTAAGAGAVARARPHDPARRPSTRDRSLGDLAPG